MKTKEIVEKPHVLTSIRTDRKTGKAYAFGSVTFYNKLENDFQEGIKIDCYVFDENLKVGEVEEKLIQRACEILKERIDLI